MAIVNRFSLPHAKSAGTDVFVKGVGLFRGGVYDVLASDTAAVSAIRAIVLAQGGVETPDVDTTVSPAPTQTRDPYPEYLRQDEGDARYALKGEIDASDIGYDIVLLMGQSNMQGANAGFDARTDPVDARIFVFESLGTYADKIVAAQEPMNHPGGTTGVGPGLPFARWYAGSTRRPVLLVPMAVGGTPLLATSGTTWNSDVRGSLYDNAVAQVKQAVAAAGPNSRVVAALWLQGETDNGVSPTQAVYATALDKLIGRLRSDLDDIELPFIVGGMVPEWVAATAQAAPIAAAHAATPSRVRYTAFAPGVTGAANAGDTIHYSPAGAREMGRRMAAALSAARANATAPAAPVPVPPVVGDITPALTTLRGTPTYGAGKFGNALSGGVLGYTGTGLISTVGTLEAWVKTTGSGLLVAVGNDGAAYSGMWLGTTDGGFAAFGDPLAPKSSTIPINDGAWHHLAATCDGANLRLWVDGVLGATSAYTGPFDPAYGTVSGGTFGIGGYGAKADFDWVGQVEEVRVSKAVRYTAPFTPPTAPFTADANTLALYHLDS